MTISKDRYIEIQTLYFDQLSSVASIPKDYIKLRDYAWPSDAAVGPQWLAAYLFVKDALRVIAGEINMFQQKILICDAWNLTYNKIDLDERNDIFFGIVNDHYVSLLLYPYAIRQRFLYFSSHILHISSFLIDPRWSESKLRDYINNDILDKFSHLKLSTFSDFKLKVESIDNKDHQAATFNFRRKLQHKDPIHVEIGLSSLISRASNGQQASYGLGGVGPLPMTVALKECISQHQASLAAYTSLTVLLDEILNIWRKERPVVG